MSVGNAQDFMGNQCNQFNDYMNEYNRAFDLTDSTQHLPQPRIASKEKAYLTQACIVLNKKQKIIGFKAGLMSESSQKKYHADEAVLGVFTEENLRDLSVEVYESDKVSLIEVELAFRLKHGIDNLVDLDNKMIELIDKVAPAIEIPLFHFKDVSSLTANDIIAANVGANVFILGDFVAIEDLDIDVIKVSLNKDGVILGRSKNAKSVDRWKSLRWLIKKSYLEGYKLKKGTIYLTGSLTDPVVARKGVYQLYSSQLKGLSLVVK